MTLRAPFFQGLLEHHRVSDSQQKKECKKHKPGRAVLEKKRYGILSRPQSRKKRREDAGLGLGVNSFVQVDPSGGVLWATFLCSKRSSC